jgi:hypothetical protein
MELDLQSLFGLHVHRCIDPPIPPLPPQLGSITRALLVSQDRRHLIVTPAQESKSQRLQKEVVSLTCVYSLHLQENLVRRSQKCSSPAADFCTTKMAI